VQLTRGDAPTVLEEAAPEARAALTAAGTDPEALRAVAAAWPAYLDAWAALAETAPDPVTAYAFARVGYHRGLDQLRQSGWRGSGRVPVSEATNRGFLSSLNQLRRAAAMIGEDAEAERCRVFLSQLDPGWREVLGD